MLQHSGVYEGVSFANKNASGLQNGFKIANIYTGIIKNTFALLVGQFWSKNQLVITNLTFTFEFKPNCSQLAINNYKSVSSQSILGACKYCLRPLCCNMSIYVKKLFQVFYRTNIFLQNRGYGLNFLLKNTKIQLNNIFIDFYIYI